MPNPWDDNPELKQAVEAHTTGRLRGQGAALKESQGKVAALEQQIAALATDGDQAAVASVEAAELASGVDALAEQLIASLPKNLQQLVPKALPKHELVKWLAVNMGALQVRTTTIPVRNGGGRGSDLGASGPTPEQRAAKVGATIFGGKVR
jgi:hypothetical protein